MVKRGEMMSVDDVQEILAVPLLGILPDDEQVVIATNQGEAIAGSGSKAGEAFTNISHRILGESVPYLDLDSKRDFSAAYSGDRRELVWVYFQAESRTPASLQKNVCPIF